MTEILGWDLLGESARLSSSAAFRHVGTVDGARLSVARARGHPPYVRCDAEIACPAAALAGYCIDRSIETQQEWAPGCVEGRLVEQIDEERRIVYVAHRRMYAVFAPRDYLYLVTCRALDDGTFVEASRSVVDPRCPPRRGFIRASIRLAWKRVRPTGPDRSDYTVVWSVDVGGWLPRPLAARAMPSQLLEEVRTFRRVLGGRADR